MTTGKAHRTGRSGAKGGKLPRHWVADNRFGAGGLPFYEDRGPQNARNQRRLAAKQLTRKQKQPT